MIKRFSFKSLGRSAAALLAGLSLSLAAADARAQSVKVTPDKENARVEITPASRDTKAVVDLLGADGSVVATLYAGSASGLKPLTIDYKALGLKAGIYNVRYREALELRVTGAVPRPDKPDGKWVNPVDVVWTPNNVYVVDAELPNDKTGDARQPATIFKFTREMRLDTSFGKEGALALGYRPGIAGIAVDSAGTVYAGGISHHISLYDWKGTLLPMRLGSTENHLKEPHSTTWANQIALGSNNRIYIGSKSSLRAYDRTKPGVEGFLYGVKPNMIAGLGRSLIASGKYVYIADNRGQIHKLEDTGKGFERLYGTSIKPADLVCGPTGFAVSGNLLWVCSRGPGPGPFWDSGGGGELLLYWDTGTSLELVQRFGTLGVAADKPQFINPTSIAVNADGNRMYVVEDGRHENRTLQDMPPGNARVRLFDITPKATAQSVLNIR